MYHNDESFFSIHSDKGVESRVISTLSKIMLDDDDYIKSYCVPSTSNIVQTNDAPIKESSRRAQSERIMSSITLSTMCRPFCHDMVFPKEERQVGTRCIRMCVALWRLPDTTAY